MSIYGKSFLATMAATLAQCLAMFNLHGYNQSKNYLTEFCANYDIVYIQEHWLLPSELHLLSDCVDGFVLFGSSALSSCVGSRILRG